MMKYGQAIHCTYILLWLFDHQSIYACSVQYPVCIKYTNFSIKLVNDIKTPEPLLLEMDLFKELKQMGPLGING